MVSEIRSVRQRVHHHQPHSHAAALPGQYFQIEDGLAYNWHRNYDPTLGRYSQADPLGFVDGPNKYSYVKSSPAMSVDPWGLHTQELEWPEFEWPPQPDSPGWWPYITFEIYKFCLKKLIETGGGGDDDPCTDRYDREVRACYSHKWDTPHPDYIPGCIARAKARQAACLRNGEPDGPNEPQEWDHNTETGDSETGRNFGR
jgi:RHS repeat-associated protein